MRQSRNPTATTEAVILQTAEAAPELFFDYRQIEDEDKRERVRFRTQQIKVRGRRVITDVWEAGNFALEVKAELEDGMFIAWANAEFGESVRTVQRWMAFARRVPRAELANTRASLSALLEATTRQTPDEVLGQVLENGKTAQVTKEQVRTLRAQHEAASQPPSPAADAGDPTPDSQPEPEPEPEPQQNQPHSYVVNPDEILLDSEHLWRVDHMATCNRALNSLRRLLTDASAHGLAVQPLREGVKNIEQYLLSL